MKKERSFVHYGWVIALTGTATLFACLGMGRFAIGMLLPSMGASLDLNYSQMGFISTGNFSGYMVSVVLAGIVARHAGARWTICIGLVLVGGSMLLIGRAVSYGEVLCLYVLTGIGSGLANVPMMGLVSHWFRRRARGRAAGAMLSGNGLAIVVTGFFVPWVNLRQGIEGWRTSWLAMGLVSMLIAALAALLLRNEPGEKGLTPLGAGPEAPAPASAPTPPSPGANRWTMVYLGGIYSLFGATYVVYATFIVTTMVQERGFGEGAAGTFWAVVGGLSVLSGPLFGGLSDRVGRKMAMMIVYSLFAVAYALVAADLPDVGLYVSVFLFGLAVWSIPTIMSAAVGDYMGAEQAVKAFGFITLFFGAGQIVGPAVAGYLADATGTFRMAFWMCTALALGAVGMTSFLRPPPSGR